MSQKFLLVDAEALPEVFLKVLKAKELLASGAARNISDAAKQVDISRSAFYKYKDSVFDAENSNEVITVLATLLDETGALQSLLAGISEAGGSGGSKRSHRHHADERGRNAQSPFAPANRGGGLPRRVRLAELYKIIQIKGE